MATIDVLLPIKNALPFLGESIDSILAQTCADWRLLILDHGSTDGSAELAYRYAERDKRIVVHVNPDAVGLGGLLNYGLCLADARYVVRQDGDDASVPHRFQTVVDVFSHAPELFVTGGEASIVDVSGHEIGYLSYPESHEAITAALFFYNPIAHPAAALNMRHLARFGALYGHDLLRALPAEQSMKVMGLAEDYFLFAQLALLGPCRNVKIPLIRYRVHRGSVSISKRDAQNACAVSVSRFLAKSFAKAKGTSSFDPAPFCSHSENVFDCGLDDYTAEFDRMAAVLTKGLGASPELSRELAFRQVLVKRNAVSMATRYGRFALEHGIRSMEYRLVRNWIGRFVTDKHVTRVEGG